MRTAAFWIVLLLLPASSLARAENGPDSSGKAAEDRRAADAALESQGWSLDSLSLHGTQEPGVRHLRATARIRLPASLLLQVLTEEPQAGQEPWPGIKESEIEAVSGDTVIARYVAGVPVYKDRRYRLRNVTDDARMEVLFTMVPGYGNVRAISGSWRVTALDDSLSRVDYTADVDPGVKWIPKFIVNWATKTAIPRLFAYIHDRGSRIQSESSD